MEVKTNGERHVVAVVGGAVSGSAAAEILADNGVLVIVIEQNDRPYGKIEDGLPRWHKKQRFREYARIDERLDRPEILFVPRTTLGTDLSFDELSLDWGLSALILANGAWRDRALQIEGVDQYIDRGLLYQNPFIFWFNHQNEKSYSGPKYTVPDGAVCIGGGLASIDVIKVIQLEIYERALRKRGLEVDMYELEHKGIPAVCKAHGVDPAELGVRNGLLFYRRRVYDMPLAQGPDKPSPEQIAKVEATRKKILDKCQEKFLFEFYDQHLPVAALEEDGRMVGLRFVRTEVDGRRAIPIPGTEVEYRSELFISSIGSVPAKIPGINMKGEYYVFRDWDIGDYADRDGVYAAGNVVTGQGNIRLSLKHGQAVGQYLVEKYLGLMEGSEDERLLPEGLDQKGQATAGKVLEDLAAKPKLAAEQVQALVDRVRDRQREVGYEGNYREWLQQVLPPDLE